MNFVTQILALLLFLSQISVGFAVIIDKLGEIEKVGLQTWIMVEKPDSSMMWPNSLKTVSGFNPKEAYVVLWMELNDNIKVYHVHYWIGRDTPEANIITAIIMTLELVDYLYSNIEFHRETHGHESTQFQSYYPHVYPQMDSTKPPPPEQYIVKGQEIPRIIRTPPGKDTLTMNDCNIVDTPSDVLVACGPEANAREIYVSDKFADNLSYQESKQKQNIDYKNPEDNAKLAEALNVREISDQDLSDVGDDADFENAVNESVKCVKVTEDGNKLEVQPINEKLRATMLLSKICLTLDVQNDSGIFVWFGRYASLIEKTNALLLAEIKIKQEDYPLSMLVRIMIEDKESDEFLQYFKDSLAYLIQSQLEKLIRSSTATGEDSSNIGTSRYANSATGTGDHVQAVGAD